MQFPNSFICSRRKFHSLTFDLIPDSINILTSICYPLNIIRHIKQSRSLFRLLFCQITTGKSLVIYSVTSSCKCCTVSSFFLNLSYAADVFPTLITSYNCVSIVAAKPARFSSSCDTRYIAATGWSIILLSRYFGS